MTKAAAQAIAECITPEYLKSDYIISSAFDTDIIKKVAKAVVKTVRNFEINFGFRTINNEIRIKIENEIREV